MESSSITILTSHQPDTILAMADEVVFISRGKAVRRLDESDLSDMDHKTFGREYAIAVEEFGE
jgi:ABC-type multidrug transport system ATPase subunit